MIAGNIPAYWKYKWWISQDTSSVHCDLLKKWKSLYFFIPAKLDLPFNTTRQSSLLSFFLPSYFFSLLNVGQEEPCFPMSGFMNSHSQCPKICKSTILTLVKKKIALNEFNEDLKKRPWRCSLNENVTASTFCLVPYKEACNKLYSAFCICYFQTPRKLLTQRS